MDLVQIYECLCDRNRLRMLHLLAQGPLCVCHFQSVLELPQTKVSQHLAYLRKRGMVVGTRHVNWMIYHLPAEMPAELETNLRCLQDCVHEDAQFQADLHRLATAKTGCEWVAGVLETKSSACC